LAEASHDAAEEDPATNQPWDLEQGAHRTAMNKLLGEAKPPEANMSATDLTPLHHRLQQTCKRETYLGMAVVPSPKSVMPTTSIQSDTKNQPPPPPPIDAFSWTRASSHLPHLLPALAGQP
jgi:hypothetical protein